MVENGMKKVILKSSDGEEFVVEEEVALISETIKHMIEDDCVDTAIPVPNVTAKILSKVIQYCKKHVYGCSEVNAYSKIVPDVDNPSSSAGGGGGGGSGRGGGELKQWDAEFIKADQDTLFDLMLAANYLDIKSLLDLSCQTVANLINGKTPQEIRMTFNITNDFTPEEEAEVKREHQWAFE